MTSKKGSRKDSEKSTKRNVKKNVKESSEKNVKESPEKDMNEISEMRFIYRAIQDGWEVKKVKKGYQFQKNGKQELVDINKDEERRDLMKKESSLLYDFLYWCTKKTL